MKHPITQILNRHIVADATMERIVQILLFVISLFVFTLSILKLSRLDLTEAQMFFGVLLSLNTTMLLTIIGLLMPMAIVPKKAGS